jgi:two-component system, chemotaxis family, sensor kinase CheA
MDECLRLYFEEAYDYLQVSEESLIRLEDGLSKEDINILFRMAHSLKGSSASMGFTEIAELTHKIEDLFDLIRNGSLSLEKYIVNKCFESFDLLKKLLDIMSNFSNDSKERALKEVDRVKNEIIKILSDNKMDLDKTDNYNTQTVYEIEKIDIFNSKFYGYVVFDEKSVMIPVRRFLFLSELKKLGNIYFSNPSIDIMSDFGSVNEENRYQFILCTNWKNEEILKILKMEEVRFVKLINISDDYLEDKEIDFTSKDIKFLDVFFVDLKEISKLIFNKYEYERLLSDDEVYNWIESILDRVNNDFKVNYNTRKILKYKENIHKFFEMLKVFIKYEEVRSTKFSAVLQSSYIDLWNELYNMIVNKSIFKSVEITKENTIINISEMVKTLDIRLFKYLIIDISQIEIIEHDELNILIEIKRTMKNQDIEVNIVNNGIYRKRLYNIFESIVDIEYLPLYYSNIEATNGFNWAGNRIHLRV